MTNFLLRLLVKNHQDSQSPQVRTAIGAMAGFVGICCNLLLFAMKLLVGILAGSVTSMVCIIAMSWILKLDPVLSASLMPKSVTSAIGAEVAQELGGIGSLAGALIILTGIVGNLSATALCRICKLHDPIARGVAIGTGSHAVGTARALQMGRVEGAVSSLSIAVAGVLTAAICPILANLLP